MRSASSTRRSYTQPTPPIPLPRVSSILAYLLHSFLRIIPHSDADELEQPVALSGAAVAWLYTSGFFSDQMPLGKDDMVMLR